MMIYYHMLNLQFIIFCVYIQHNAKKSPGAFCVHRMNRLCCEFGHAPNTCRCGKLGLISIWRLVSSEFYSWIECLHF